MARLRIPSASVAAEPSASRCAGMPKSIRPPTPASTAAPAASTSDERVCCTTPGIDSSGDGFCSDSFTKIGNTRSAGCKRVSATSRRSAGVRRSRRGRTTGNAAPSVIAVPSRAPAHRARRPSNLPSGYAIAGGTDAGQTDRPTARRSRRGDRRVDRVLRARSGAAPSDDHR